MILTTRTRLSIALLACAGMFAVHVFADGPSGYGPRQIEAETEYERIARDAYGMGYALIESANRLDLDADAAIDEHTRRLAVTHAQKKYEEALVAFSEAARLEPRMYEAHTYIGYANRKLGRYDRALAAYTKALLIKPDYARAIEYQGEAYLGLDQFEKARFNYLRLYGMDAAQAHKLLNAMQAWLNARQQEGSVSRQTMDDASQWIAARRGNDTGAASESNPW